MKQPEKDFYETPEIMDLAPVSVVTGEGEGTSPAPVDDTPINEDPGM